MARLASILFPDNVDKGSDTDEQSMPDCFADLHLDQVVEAIVGADSSQSLPGFFYRPLHDASAVAYRHDVFRDLQRPEVRAAVDAFAEGMKTMRQRRQKASELWYPLQKQGWFVYAVQAFCDATQALSETLADLDLWSRGLVEFAAYVRAYACGDAFIGLLTETRRVQEDLRRIRYCVHIEGLSVHVAAYHDEPDYSVEVAGVFERFASEALEDHHVRIADYADMNHVEEKILECVAELHPEQFSRLHGFCAQHRGYLDPTISRFEREVAFYLSYLRFMDNVTETGVAFCYPEITGDPAEILAESAFDVALASKVWRDGTTLVCNDFHLSQGERIIVVTGPNQGGKTTLARTVGQLAYLGSLGCPVPARRARLTLPDAVYTHFERQENLATLRGKLDDELVRIHDILSRATDASIIVMNESFSSTTVEDSILIGSEVLHRISAVGCVAVYVTFLDELADIDPVCVSMVGAVDADDPTVRTFVFTRRPADGMAYAAALADKYGLTNDALLERIVR